METPTWQKSSLTCKCSKVFKPSYRNGLLQSRDCPNCRLKASYKEVKPKEVQLHPKFAGVSKTPVKRLKTDRQKAMDRADKVFSQYIRVKFSFVSGGELFCKDIITGKLHGIKLVDNGHCMSRKFKALRYWIDNCRPQNRSSNRFSGEADHYTFIDNLKAEIGEERFDLLESMRNDVVHDSVDFYRMNFELYTLLLKEELKQKGVNNPWTKIN